MVLAPTVGLGAEGVRPFDKARLGAALYAAAKRAIDVAVAVTLLIALLPLLALIGLAICVDSGFPILYRAERVGRFGRTFTVLKFRSMRAGADSLAHVLFIRSLMNGTATACELYKVTNDRRITRVGAFLRRSSLDEVPQLWNVLRGEMSLVGPRPERPEFVTLLNSSLPTYSARHVIRPGVTGWAQVQYKYGSSVEDAAAKLEYDLYYIRQ